MEDLEKEAAHFQNVAETALKYGGALEAYVYLHQVEKIVNEAKKQVQEAAIEERETYDRREEVTSQGFAVSIMETSRYSYNDPEIDRLKALVKTRENLAKKALQFSESGNTFYDENGEIIPPAERKYITTLKVELKK